MRIALVSLHTSPLATAGSGDAGGLNVFVVGLADALTAAGHDVELLTRHDGGAEAAATDPRTPGGTLVRFLDAGPRASVAKSQLVQHAAAFGRSMAESAPFDIVHSNYWLSGLAALPVANGWHAPHVLSLHTVAALKNERLAPGDIAEPASRLDGERALVRGSALIVAHTAAERQAIIHHYGGAAERIAVVAPGVDTALFHPAVVRGGPFVLVLARIQPLKGVDLAIRALAAMAPAERPRLVIAGGVSPGHDTYAAELRRLVHESGLGGRVEFLPAQSRTDAAALLRSASLLLVPSYSETFGIVALEAAASGTPVIAARTTGLLDSVADGTSGVLLDTRDPAVWGQAITGLLADGGRLTALSATAAAWAAPHSWPATADAIASLYAQLLHGRPRTAPDPTPAESPGAESPGAESPSADSPGAESPAALARRAALETFGAHPVFVHAHPDDESISTGGTIAALLAAGAQVTLLTGTRGERGEVVPGPLHHLEGTAELAPHRELELAHALAALTPSTEARSISPESTGAVSIATVSHAFLGTPPARAAAVTARLYSDSGMRWGAGGFAEPADDASPRSLSLAPLAEVVADVLAGIRALAPGATSVVSYDALGGYGHPDHVRMHDAGIEAARLLNLPFFAIVEPRVEPVESVEPAEPTGSAGPTVEPSVELPERHLEAPPKTPPPTTITIPLASHAHLKAAAMAAHATQLTVDAARQEFTLSGGQTHPIGRHEQFRRVEPDKIVRF